MIQHEKYYVYTILSLRDFSLYTSLTTDLKKRIDEHVKGLVSNTSIRIPFKLVHFEYFINYEDALRRKNHLKTGAGKACLKDSLLKTLSRKASVAYRMIK